MKYNKTENKEGVTMLAERLKLLREEKELKQESLANELGCTRFMISYYENGREPPNDILVAYSKYFDVSTDWLLGLTHERKPNSNELSEAFQRLAGVAGKETITANETIVLLRKMADYYKKGTPCSDIPVSALRGFMANLCVALSAAIAEDFPALIDSTNAATVAALEVTKMPAAFYAGREG